MNEEMKDVSTDSDEQFLEMITQYQSAIRGYIRGSIGDYHDSNDVFQKTNIILFKKSKKWDRSIPFLQWAFAVAKFEILAFYRDKSREKVVFNDEVLELVINDCSELAATLPDRNIALRHCLSELTEEKKLILTFKYVSRERIDYIGNRLGKSADSVRSLLKRVRSQLRDCVTKKLEMIK